MYMYCRKKHIRHKSKVQQQVSIDSFAADDTERFTLKHLFQGDKWEHSKKINTARNSSLEIFELLHSSEQMFLSSSCSLGYMMSMCN